MTFYFEENRKKNEFRNYKFHKNKNTYFFKCDFMLVLIKDILFSFMGLVTVEC